MVGVRYLSYVPQAVMVSAGLTLHQQELAPQRQDPTLTCKSSTSGCLAKKRVSNSVYYSLPIGIVVI